MLNIDECDIPPQDVKTTQTYIQLVQINEFDSVKVIQCKIEIDRIIKRCGMFSHTMDIHNGKHSYIEETSLEECRRIHTIGVYEIGRTFIRGLQSNKTISRSITLAGNVETDGSCDGNAYSDPYGTWTDVVVLARCFTTVKITLQDYIADVRLNTN